MMRLAVAKSWRRGKVVARQRAKTVTRLLVECFSAGLRFHIVPRPNARQPHFALGMAGFPCAIVETAFRVTATFATCTLQPVLMPLLFGQNLTVTSPT